MLKIDYQQGAKALGEMLCELREKRNLTRTALARRLGKSWSYVSKNESGTRRMKVIEIVPLCAALDLDLVEFGRLYDVRMRAIERRTKSLDAEKARHPLVHDGVDEE